MRKSLKNYTTFKIGGPVKLMYFPVSQTELTVVCKTLDGQGITPLILGNGSNILASDGELDIVVINTTKLTGISLNEERNEIMVEAGVLLSKLAVFAFENGLTGLEFAHGIPGTVGGAVVMNAGAYGGEMKDIVISTTAYNKDLGIHALTAAENEFAYRHSRFSDSSDIVLSAVIRLQKGDKNAIKQKMDELSLKRRESQPLDLPSGGSTFKRPKEGYAAALIEQAGLKGFSIGGASVSQKHSGFIVNNGNATFSDVMAVIEHVQKEVLNKFFIELEPEIKIVR